MTPLSDVSPNTSVVEKKKKKKKKDKDIDTDAAEDVTVKTEPDDNGIDSVSWPANFCRNDFTSTFTLICNSSLSAGTHFREEEKEEKE